MDRYDKDLGHYVNVRTLDGEKGKVLLRENRHEMFKALVEAEKENKVLKTALKRLVSSHSMFIRPDMLRELTEMIDKWE